MIEEKFADVIVAGAGPAGVCAAVTAARQGVTVILAGNRPGLGGNSSSEIRVWTRGAVGAGNLFAEEMGVWGDFKMRNLYVNPDANPVLWDDVLLDFCLNEPKLELLLNTHILEPELRDGKIVSLRAVQLNSEREFRLIGKMYIDCTGDGTIGGKAAVPYIIGKEGREQYGESLAPEERDGTSQGNSILFFSKIADHSVKFIPPSYAFPMEAVENLINKGGRVLNEAYGGSDYWWFEYGGAGDIIGDAQTISLELRRLLRGVWNYIKNSGKFDAENRTLEWVGSHPGKRASRRMITDHVVTQADLIKRGGFYDGAFYGGWYMDFHPSGGFASEENGCKQYPVQIYELPLRCLYNSAVPNLLFAGRDIGTSHVVFASSRIMNTCGLSGQAAGTAAAWCAKREADVTKLNEETAKELRQILLRDDMLLLNQKNEDVKDLARGAKMSASSFFDGDYGEPVSSVQMEEGFFLTIPRPLGNEAELLLSAEEDTTLKGKWHTADIPSRYIPGAGLGEIKISIPKGQLQSVKLILPESEPGFLTLTVTENKALSLHCEEVQRAGFLCGYKEKPLYYYPCVKGDYSELYAPAKVLNGFNRPYLEPNLWIAAADDERPTLKLDWEEIQIVAEIRLYLNPDLSKEIPSSRAEVWAEEHKFAARQGMPPELVRAYEIQTWDGESWKTVFVEENNWRRMSVARLTESVQTKALRIVFTGDSRAELFEIRVY